MGNRLPISKRVNRYSDVVKSECFDERIYFFIVIKPFPQVRKKLINEVWLRGIVSLFTRIGISDFDFDSSD